ncbi:TetR family transcriptional regulator [Actinophytocola oryzae]|uniref:TetR family transcriptional regulator n=2 Tax=Actinophytocola oryzae TaxID=502181 RepID=A0A4R7UY37_9PSEU|nr:TetR family transcriptional regulator [Actinophytocola oryzae]
MAVYTHFGSMSGLVREIVYEGFSRLQNNFSMVKETDDPVADLCVHGRAYRGNALANSYLYSAMFGGEALAGFELTEEDRQHGRYVLASIVNCVNRCVDTGRFRQADVGMVAHHMWFAMHGLVNLELGRYLIEPWGAKECFETQLVTLVVGAGDDLETATESVAVSGERYAVELEA